MRGVDCSLLDLKWWVNMANFWSSRKFAPDISGSNFEPREVLGKGEVNDRIRRIGNRRLQWI